MLVEAKFEVHAHDCKIITAVGQDEVERTWSRAPPHFVAQGDVDVVLALSCSCRWLEEAKDRLRIAEDILGAHEASHGTSHREDCSLSRDGSRSALGVRELLACADGAEGNVMCYCHANGTFNLFNASTQECTVHSCGCNGTMHNVVDFVALQAEDLCKASADFIQGDHGQQSLFAIYLPSHLCCCHDHWIEVVVPKLTCIMSRNAWVESKDSAVGVPFSDCGGVRCNDLLWGALRAAAKDCGSFSISIGQSLFSQNGRCIGLQRQRRDATHDGVCVKHLHPLVD
mmetsp:Transcript_12105/g.25331  ORF Transcript_12105/g.25331 Transcript_12105/m.25331 type:complete len:285 (+) Transcript_12105:733-1587(+)